MAIPRPVIVMLFFILILLTKYLRRSDLVLNVFWLIKTSRVAPGAVSLAVCIPWREIEEPLLEFKFPHGNFGAAK
jgi:hypothetical protein